MRPAAGQIASARGRRSAGKDVFIEAIPVGRNRQGVARGRLRIDAESALAHSPRIVGVVAVREDSVVTIEVLAVRSVGGVRADCPAIPDAGKIVERCSAARLGVRPCVSLELRVMMLMTPFTALAPHTAPPGPLMTSIRST